MTESDELLTPAQAAELLQLRPQTLASWRMTGRYGLPYVVVGRKIRYRRRDIRRWLDERTRGAVEDVG